MPTPRKGVVRGKPRANPRAASSRSRRETAAEKRERVAREERNRKARERRAAAKRAAEAAERAAERAAEKAKQERNRKARERRAAAKKAAEEAAKKAAPKRRRKKVTAQVETVLDAMREDAKKAIRRAERNRKDRDRRARRKREKEGPVSEIGGAPSDLPPPEYEKVEGEEHPKAGGEAMGVAELVLLQWREELARIAREVGGRSRTHLYRETGEVSGSVWRDAPEDLGDLPTLLGAYGDAFRPASTGVFYAETFFQGFATVIVAGGKKDRRRNGSPLNESHVGPDGKHYKTAVTWWFRGDAQKCIATIGYMIANVMRGRPEFQIVKLGVRQYWSPVGRRPDR